GHARYEGAKFPTAGDEHATYRNSIFAIRPFMESWDDDHPEDRNRVAHPANFEHFATGLKIQFYKRLY
ncbi:hypothetical protein, partial [Enterobacter hormaechei]|uniref:hypothetical protein n=1 Tax=Enterobacter hormaechei TaxID=158836 RepID=UPI0013D0EB30